MRNDTGCSHVSRSRRYVYIHLIALLRSLGADRRPGKSADRSLRTHLFFFWNGVNSILPDAR